jgi:Flp pilus assembly protein TadD
MHMGNAFMNPRFETGRIFYAQRRYDLAANEFRKALGIDPNHCAAMSMLALCLSELKKHRQAIETAKQAIAIAPDDDYGHYALAHVLSRCHQHNGARKAAREAIRLNPDRALYYGELAFIEFSLGNWATALKVAENGLNLHPEEINCRMARIRALDRLGRKTESKQEARDLLQLVPEDHYAHMNIGWSFLEHGDHVQALEHFRESLRIDPNMEFTQRGLIEALQCRFVGYRITRRLLVWIQTQRHKSLDTGTTIMWICLFPLLPLLFLVLLIAKPLFSVFLRFNRSARRVITRDQLLESNLNCVLVAIAVSCFISYFVTGREQLILAFMSFLAATFLVTVAFRSPAGRPRWIALLLSAIFVLGIVVFQFRLWLVTGGNAPTQVWDEILVALGGTYYLFLILLAISTRVSKIVPKL